MFIHVKKLERVGFFAAPSSGKVSPSTVSWNMECLEVLTDGVILHESEGVEKEYRRGAVFWHLPGEQTIWNTTSEEPYRCVVFLFEVTEAIRQAPEVSYWPIPEDAAEFSERCLKLFHAGIEDIDLFTTYTYSTMLWNTSSPKTSPPGPAALQSALKYIKGHWQEPIEAEDIAKYSEISKPYLFALFREHLGTSPYKYILTQRINRAKFMLANSNTSIKEIATACGFSSLEVFYRQFKKSVKVPPAEYRKSVFPYNFDKE